MVLSAAVMKADGKHLKSELDYIRKFFSQQFGDAVAAEQIGILKELLKKDIPVRQVCMQIKYLMQHPCACNCSSTSLVLPGRRPRGPTRWTCSSKSQPTSASAKGLRFDRSDVLQGRGRRLHRT